MGTGCCNRALAFVLVMTACAGALGCSGSVSDERGTANTKGHRRVSGSGDNTDAGAFGNPNGPAVDQRGDGGMHVVNGPSILAAMRIEPENGTLEVKAGSVGKLNYKVFGKLEGSSDEVDITARTVFYVPDNWRIGGFDKGGPTFKTSSKDPRGGVLTVQATAANSDGTTRMVQTSLTVHYTATPKDPRDDGSATFKLPSDPAVLFAKAKADSTRAPALVYPNDGVMLPPNLARLSVHFRPGSTANTLFELHFSSASIDMTFYARCGAKVDNGCVLELDRASFQLLADSNRQGNPIKLQVRATDDKGAALGASDEFTLSFASTDVRGGLYYWKTDEPVGIMRFDFGSPAGNPQPFLLDDDPRLNRALCVGCHAISRDGTKVIASQDGQHGGYQVLINDLTRDPMAANFLTQNGDDKDRLQFASFSPKGDRVVAVFGDGDDGAANPNTLWFLNGDTGMRLANESFELPWEPDHPEWSPDGKMIALTRVGKHNTSQRPKNSGIEVLPKDAKGANKGWGDPITVVPIAAGLNRYNPNFLPDSSLFVFSESTCPSGDIDSDQCDGDADPTAKTWAVKPEAGAKPVLLARVAQGGVEDQGATDLSDTFPRNAPFESDANDTEFAEGKVYWVTVASTRRAGLYNASTKRLLWMFAVDPAKVRVGRDGSFPPFYLPFQDLNTSNHIAQWTQQIVTDMPPPPPPDPPVPPPPPPPPIPE